MISILVPIYNVEKYIKQCIHSLFVQTYQDIEYIFIDDCSTDNSMAILRQYITKYPHKKSQIKIIKHEHNKGIAAARNTALDNAHGDFILFVDSDDWLEFNAIEKLVKKQSEEDADIVIFSAIHHFSDHNEIRTVRNINNPNILAQEILKRKATVYLWNKFIRLSIFKDNDVRTIEGINMTEDFLITPRLAYFANKITTLNEPLYHYNRQNEASYSFFMTEEKLDAIWLTLDYNEKFFKNKGDVFNSAINEGKVNMLIRQIIIVCTLKNKSYYNKLRKKKLTFKIENMSQYGKIEKLLIGINNYYISRIITLLIPYINKIRSIISN